jgi:amino acid adenylation domain-containing protein
MTPQLAMRLQYVEAQVGRLPETIAVRYPGATPDRDICLTYRELDGRANQLARYLHTLGVGPEVPVGLFMERSLEMVVAILGIFKAGGAYVPMDPDYPPDRLAFMLHHIRPPVTLTQSFLQPKLSTYSLRPTDDVEAHTANTAIVCLDTEWAMIGQELVTRPVCSVTSQNLASIFYTSGSTGRPKAVLRTHTQIADPRGGSQADHILGEQDRHLLKSSPGFTGLDAEVFTPLMTGGQMVIVPPGKHQDTGYLVQLIATYGITAMYMVPSLLGEFLEEPGLESCRSLRDIFCFGEALPIAAQERLFDRLNVGLSVYYGTTEAPSATFWRRRRGDGQKIIGLGWPIPDRQVYLLDSHMQPVPAGEAGELYIGGRLARGYSGQPALTAECFLPNPFGTRPGERLYRTGDQARYRPDGSLEFLGRLDDQVQIRGARVELGEVETILRQHPAVGATVVLAQQVSGPANRVDNPGHAAEEQYLVAYIVPAQHASAPTPLALRGFLQQQLPDYMVPTVFVFLEKLPLNPNGKLDRQALLKLAPDRFLRTTPYVAPRTALEEVLARMWGELLGVANGVGIDDNFFDLGGHSLTATRIVAWLRHMFGLDLPPNSLFETQTVAELARLLHDMSDEPASIENRAQILLA